MPSRREEHEATTLKELVPLPVVPAWGKSFVSWKQWNPRFKDYLWEAHQSNPAVKTMVLFVAGNDLGKGYEVDWITDEMTGLQEYWAKQQVKLVYVNVIPSGWHKC